MSEQLQKQYKIKVEKVDRTHGVVLGFGCICRKSGAAYFDTHGEHLPEDEMFNAAVDFMKGDRLAKLQHEEGSDIGRVIFAYPLTEDIAKAHDIECDTSGLLIGIQVEDKEALKALRSGALAGFSFGGSCTHKEIVDA